jgi:peptidoglycan/xylan/chitin deacetylase (PgdA/CDA1 family)
MSRLPHLGDELWHLNMDFATVLGKRMLPSGNWSGTAHDGTADNAKPRLFLTFDDGPCPKTTPYLLDLLAQEEVSATFFVIGAHAEKHPQLLERIAQAGHTVGSHGYSHQALPLMTTKSMESDLARAKETLQSITGTAPYFFRPPYGVLDARGARCVAEQKMSTVYWSVVAQDWLPIGTARVVARVNRKLHNNALIVLHEKWFPKQTIQATKAVI